jgi:hypothetical protein
VALAPDARERALQGFVAGGCYADEPRLP